MWFFFILRLSAEAVHSCSVELARKGESERIRQKVSLLFFGYKIRCSRPGWCLLCCIVNSDFAFSCPAWLEPRASYILDKLDCIPGLPLGSASQSTPEVIFFFRMKVLMLQIWVEAQGWTSKMGHGLYLDETRPQLKSKAGLSFLVLDSSCFLLFML